MRTSYFSAFFLVLRSSHRRCSIKKVILETSQNSQENTCARVSLLIKLQANCSKTNKGEEGKNYHNWLFNSTALFVVYKWPLTLEDVVTKWNEIKLKCLKFCSLNIVGIFARLQTKVDLKLKGFSKVRLGPAFPLLRLHCGNMSRISGFWGSHWGHDFPFF